MPEYRVYELKDGKHVSMPPMIIDAPNDGAVTEKAKELLKDVVLEVWELSRLVARLEPNKYHSQK